MKLIVLFGKPGAGKGTQVSRFLKGREEEWETLSTGEMIRQAIKSGTKLGKQVKSYSEKGKLVPDEIVVKIVEDKLDSLTNKNIILDGFPRNISQAATMIKMGMIPDKIVCIDASNQQIVERLSKRIVCGKCGETFSLGAFKPPKQEGICDECGSKLIRRKDDEPEVVKNRLKIHEEETEAVLNFMKDNNIKVEIIASDMSMDIIQQIFNNLMES